MTETNDHTESEQETATSDNSTKTEGSGPDNTAKDTTVDDLPREKKLAAMFANSGEAAKILKEDWSEERAQVYFMFYSLTAAGALLYLLYRGLTIYLIAGFAIYAITIIPILYKYERETYFEPDDELLTDE